MAKCVSFHTQLTTIMDIMTKTALAQICKLFEEDSSKLRKEMLRVKKENSVLKDRLRYMENELKTTRRVGKGAMKHTKTYHTIGIQTGESNRSVDRENTGHNRAPSINGIFGKEWCANLWKDAESRKCTVNVNPDHAETWTEFVDECREDEQDQIELLTIKEEESEVDISDRNLQNTPTKEKGSWVSDRSETSSTDGHITDTARKGGPSITADSAVGQDDLLVGVSACVDFTEGNEALLEGASTSADYTEGHANLLNSSTALQGQDTEFINLDGTMGQYVLTVPAAGYTVYDEHCVPIEYEYDGEEGEEVVGELIAFEGISENPSQPVIMETKALTGDEVEESFDYFDRFELQQTPKRKNKFNCKICGKKYVKYVTLKEHLKIHKREPVYHCRVCKSVFPQKNLLRTHKCTVAMANVENKVKNTCEYCGRAFTTNANLRVHYVVHTGERPHKCDICGKSFTQKGNLNIHRRIHTGEKPFSCPVCHKCFSQKINLRHHVATHGEKYARSLGKKTKEK